MLAGVKASTPAARSLLDTGCAPGGQERRSAPRNSPTVSPRNDPNQQHPGPAKIREGQDTPTLKFRDQKTPIQRPFARSGSLTLDPPDATSDQSGVPLLDEDYLNLSTIHSAKGQEWNSVFVLNVVDGCIPSDLGTGQSHEIEEERRLLYVAMTRAEDDLHLMVPQRFFTHGQNPLGDRHVYAARSRFMPKALIPLFECTAWPIAASDGVRSAVQGPKLDVAARMRAMWGKQPAGV